MKKILFWIVIALLLFVTFIIALAPASAIFPWVTSKVPHLYVSEPAGTLWSTQISTVQYKHIKIDNISLDSNPLKLLLGRLNSTIDINDNSLKVSADIDLSSKQVVIQNAKYHVSGDWLTQFLPPPIKNISGEIFGTLIDASVSSDKKINALVGQGDWKAAVVEYPKYRLELGDFKYRMEKLDDINARVTIEENTGPLDLKGHIDIGLDRTYQLQLNTKDDLPENLGRWLKVMGKQQNQRIYIEWKGTLPL